MEWPFRAAYHAKNGSASEGATLKNVVAERDKDGVWRFSTTRALISQCVMCRDLAGVREDKYVSNIFFCQHSGQRGWVQGVVQVLPSFSTLNVGSMGTQVQVRL